MKRLQFIILSLAMFCTGMVLTNIESYANDPPGVNIDIDMNFDVVAVENFELGVIEGAIAVYSCDLTLWPGTEDSLIRSNRPVTIYNRVSVLNKGSTDYIYLYTYTLRLVDLNDHNVTDNDRMPMKASGGEQNHSFLRV